MEIQRGDIYYAELTYKDDSIQTGIRPCIVVSNQLCNHFSPVITIVPVTSKLNKHQIPTHVILGIESSLPEQSIALAEQVMPLNKKRLKRYIGKCTDYIMNEIDKAILIQNQLEPVDINKIFNMINNINEVTDFINTTNSISALKERNIYMMDLRQYCSEYNIDYNGVIVKQLRKLNKFGGIENDKRTVAIAR